MSLRTDNTGDYCRVIDSTYFAAVGTNDIIWAGWVIPRDLPAANRDMCCVSQNAALTGANYESGPGQFPW